MILSKKYSLILFIFSSHFNVLIYIPGRHRSSEIRTVAAKLYRASYECFAHIRGVYSLGTEVHISFFLYSPFGLFIC